MSSQHGEGCTPLRLDHQPLQLFSKGACAPLLKGSSSQGGMQSRHDRAVEIEPPPLCTLPIDQVPLCYYYKMFD